MTGPHAKLFFEAELHRAYKRTHASRGPRFSKQPLIFLYLSATARCRWAISLSLRLRENLIMKIVLLHTCTMATTYLHRASGHVGIPNFWSKVLAPIKLAALEHSCQPCFVGTTYTWRKRRKTDSSPTGISQFNMSDQSPVQHRLNYRKYTCGLTLLGSWRTSISNLIYLLHDGPSQNWSI